jgi:hypothetical protein
MEEGSGSVPDVTLLLGSLLEALSLFIPDSLSPERVPAHLGTEKQMTKEGTDE